LTGLPRWTSPAGGCADGTSGRTVVYHGGRLYRRDESGGVFDARTGARLRGLTSGRAPAVTDRAVFTVNGQTLSATSPETGAQLWSCVAARR
jgi:hypothetical protein